MSSFAVVSKSGAILRLKLSLNQQWKWNCCKPTKWLLQTLSTKIVFKKFNLPLFNICCLGFAAMMAVPSLQCIVSFLFDASGMSAQLKYEYFVVVSCWVSQLSWWKAVRFWEMQRNADKYCNIGILDFFFTICRKLFLCSAHLRQWLWCPIIGLLYYSLSKGHNACQKWSENC